MFTQLFTVMLVTLLGAMSPGPDFAIVVRNTILYSRPAGFSTAAGISAAIIFHITYCILGLGIVIAQSVVLYNIIKYIGAFYLMYLGAMSLRAHPSTSLLQPGNNSEKKGLPRVQAFKQGLLCNLLNPKASLFFLSFFTVLIKPTTPLGWQLLFAASIILTTLIWFCTLVIILSHPRIKRSLDKLENYIVKVLGLLLIGLAIIILVK